MKLLLSLATALLLSTSALAMDSGAALNLGFSGGGVSAQADQFYSYNFGTTSVNFPRFADFTLTNYGPDPLAVHQIATAGADFDAYHGCPSVLPPNMYCTIRVRFSPWTEGFKTGRLYIMTSSGRIIIDMSGWGTRY